MIAGSFVKRSGGGGRDGQLSVDVVLRLLLFDFIIKTITTIKIRTNLKLYESPYNCMSFKIESP